MAQGKLTAVFVRNTKQPGKYHDGGGIGLFLWVKVGGGKFWVQRVTIEGKRREIGLGSFPLVSLGEAREMATDNKRKARQGENPLREKQTKKSILTFRKATERFLKNKTKEFSNPKHIKQWQSTLETYALPVLGNMPVNAIALPDILRTLEPIWQSKTETATRLRGRIEAVLSWATVAGYREGDNPARWKGNLSEILPKPNKLKKGDNQPALALQDLPQWWSALQEREGMAAKALMFLTLTACRSGEVRGMVWDEVDLKATEGPIWTIPKDRMKMSKEHRVPLPVAAKELLEALPRMEDSPYVFFAVRGGALSDMTISAVMRRMNESEIKSGNQGWLDPRSKRPAVPHGLRSSFRDWAAERGIERDLAEISLAHKVGSEVERAYRRSDMLQRRRAILEEWAQFVGGANNGATVVSLREAKK